MAALVPAEGPILEQILDESYDIWNDGLSRTAYGRYWRAQIATAWGRTHLERYALVEGGGLLASGKLYAFDAVLAGRAIRVAGLGAIFTSPAHRGRGTARELVDRLLTLAVDRGANAALLFSEIGPEYYQRLGFAPIPTNDRTIRVREDARRGAPATIATWRTSRRSMRRARRHTVFT